MLSLKSSTPCGISTKALSTHQSVTKETATTSTYCAAGSGMLTIQQQRAVAPCAPQSELYQQGGPQFLVPAAWRQPAQFQLSEQQGEFAMPAILDTLQHLPTHHTNWPSHHRQCRVCGRAATLGSMLLLPTDDLCCSRSSTCSLSVRMMVIRSCNTCPQLAVSVKS